MKIDESNAMNIDEIKALKQETEEQIYHLLMDFCKKSGLSVMGIDVDADVVRITGNPTARHYTLLEVRLDVKI